ncbi:carboxymuconolactone decarboxylase family protein [Microbispora triticiradicis]|uniref:Carboxymuconolactone decarboxylase family protein n=3 Tax=Microbispora TaxID=2005 RepID=A0ABY3LTU9_9ACTN|nr:MULTISPECIES: carboxymuconolactone decarboxylase family protein [Microbispora]RGA06341.1 carboxymuconolactone decarboxylase family protein [Microbispora triticiradicis]TLP52141.1 carboxymuconolactone decarboxylase family protein [Microbispora fusca]TYB54416.1 carboxymuconolactone decarboxylase family protein [Microbispora tritici]GLW25059.1 alkyl hydroperoxide reductase AhpD [Microbispora amethystogenes]
MSTERMPNPAALIPEAMEALMALNKAIAGAGADGKLLALSHLRASQINGCAPCVAGGVHQAQRHGVTADQVHAVAAWRETPWFSDEERAALALTEAVTRLADQADPVPDQVWDMAAKHFDQKELAALLLNIAITNAFNRLNVPTRRQAGTW